MSSSPDGARPSHSIPTRSSPSKTTAAPTTRRTPKASSASMGSGCARSRRASGRTNRKHTDKKARLICAPGFVPCNASVLFAVDGSADAGDGLLIDASGIPAGDRAHIAGITRAGTPAVSPEEVGGGHQRGVLVAQVLVADAILQDIPGQELGMSDLAM